MFTAWPRFMRFLYLSYSLSQHWRHEEVSPESIKEWSKVVWDMTAAIDRDIMNQSGEWNIMR